MAWVYHVEELGMVGLGGGVQSVVEREFARRDYPAKDFSLRPPYLGRRGQEMNMRIQAIRQMTKQPGEFFDVAICDTGFADCIYQTWNPMLGM